MKAFDVNPHSMTHDNSLRPAPRNGFSGFIEGVTLHDLVQLACLENKQRKLVVQMPSGIGEIYFSSGEVVHAKTATCKGEDAFFEIMLAGNGTFRFYLEPSPEQTIETPWNFLVIEALRRKDEGKSGQEDKQISIPGVLIVDDSKFFVARLRDAFIDKVGAKVIGEARNGRDALQCLEASKPDIITLDINMPVMAGDIALKHIMIRSPAPVLLISSFNDRQVDKIMEFLRLGAVEFIPKPSGNDGWEAFCDRLKRAVNASCNFNIKNIRRARTPGTSSEKVKPGMPAKKLIVMLGGPGGLLELQKILPSMRLDGSTALICFQDMSHQFVPAMAGYMDRRCVFSIKFLDAGAPLLSNQAWISDIDSGWNIEADETGAGIYKDASINMLNANSMLKELSRIFNGDLTVVLLSGIDVDLQLGLQAVSSRDGRIIVQDPQTCLCPTPIEAVRIANLEDMIMPSEEISSYLNSLK